jgi:hypothetical protein
MSDNFEAAAELRQKVRVMKREEKKRTENEAKNGNLDAKKVKEQMKYAKDLRNNDLAKLKGELALEKLEAKRKIEAKKKEREDMLGKTKNIN